MLDDLRDALGAAPRLDGALCRGSTMFDEAPPGTAADLVAERIAEAVAVCERCPSLRACNRWLNGLAPPQRPAGVVAGRVSVPEPLQQPRRRARSDLREALDATLRADPRAADNELARLIGCHDSSVAAARKRLESAGAIPRVRRPGGRPRGGRR
jgi:hypothetical protein